MPKQKKKAKSKRDDSFESVAKRLECDPDMDKFLKTLGKIAKAKPTKPPKPRGG